MELKDFQNKALEVLEQWVEKLESRHYDGGTLASHSWRDMREIYPHLEVNYKNRERIDRKEIPNACIKIPTGGGKTFTAANALMLIMRKWEKKQTGLVIWVVPSQSIYEQTLKSLRKKGEWIHQHLKQYSGGRLKVFTREDNFTKNDIDNHLCIMVLIAQSFVESENGSRDTKRLRISRTGNYSEFFPDSGNILASEEFLKKHSLDAMKGTNIPIQSLKNVIRINNPVVIVDEAHRFTNNLAFEEINKLNPSIILEFSATPLDNSNILYEATGQKVWNEDMIKLPIEIYNTHDWQDTLKAAVEKRENLEEIAHKEKRDGGNYIRPIVVIRADYTGKKQIGKTVHAKQAKDFLISEGIPHDHIAIQSSEQKDLKGVNLLSDQCQIKYIITKDALKEGWDCPFASVLAILNENLQSATAMTQLIGRVMRQPYAKKAKSDELNKPHIFCYTEDVNRAIDLAKAGLAAEGYQDVRDLIYHAGGGHGRERKETRRRKEFADYKIYFPKVTIIDGKDTREYNYDRDMLPEINWDNIKYENDYKIGSSTKISKGATVDLYGVSKFRGDAGAETVKASEFDIIYLTERLRGIVPNIFVAARIINDSFMKYKKKHSFEEIYFHRIAIVEHMKIAIAKQVQQNARDLFDAMIKKEKINFSFIKGMEFSYWEAPQTDFFIDNDRDIYNQKKYLFEEINNSSMNSEEGKAASYFEKNEIIEWWFRTTPNTDRGYYLQGWKRERFFPDFLIATSTDKKGVPKYLAIETKGAHLEGNDDTIYKRELTKLINENVNKGKTTETYHFKVLGVGELTTELESVLQG